MRSRRLLKIVLFLCFNISIASFGVYQIMISSATSPSAYAYGPLTYSSTTPAAPGNTYSWTFDVGVTNFYELSDNLPYQVAWNVSVGKTNGGARYEAVTITSQASGGFTITRPGNNTRTITISWRTENECGGTIYLNVTATDKNGAALKPASKGFAVNAGPTCHGGEDPSRPPGPTPSPTPSPTPAPAPSPSPEPSTGPSLAPGAAPNPSPTPSPNPSPSAGTSGGGSTAKKQADQPNPIPTSSSQGDVTEQPEVEPSPFFDGKTFDKGSDEDLQRLSSLPVTGALSLKNVVFGAGVVVLTAASSLGVWWWRGRR